MAKDTVMILGSTDSLCYFCQIYYLFFYVLSLFILFMIIFAVPTGECLPDQLTRRKWQLKHHFPL